MDRNCSASLPILSEFDSFRDNFSDETRSNYNVHENGDELESLPRRRDFVVDLQYILLNTACTVAIVFINKLCVHSVPTCPLEPKCPV